MILVFISLSEKDNKNNELFLVSNAKGNSNKKYTINIINSTKSFDIVSYNNIVSSKEDYNNVLSNKLLQDVFILNNNIILSNIAAARLIQLEKNKNLTSTLADIGIDNEKNSVVTDEYGFDDSSSINVYTKQLSVWVANHLTNMYEILYSNDSYGVLKIKLNRSGTLLNTSIFISTGYEMIDDMLISSIQKYNPLPSVPDDYMPWKNSLDFLVPVHLKTK